MEAWLIAREWEAVFAAAALAAVPAWAWLVAGALAGGAWVGPGRAMAARLARGIGATFTGALAALALVGGFAAWRVGDPALAAQLRAHAATPFLTALAGGAACGFILTVLGAWRVRRAPASASGA